MFRLLPHRFVHWTDLPALSHLARKVPCCCAPAYGAAARPLEGALKVLQLPLQALCCAAPPCQRSLHALL